MPYDWSGRKVYRRCNDGAMEPSNQPCQNGDSGQENLVLDHRAVVRSNNTVGLSPLSQARV
jgi:ankyrin repeat protein